MTNQTKKTIAITGSGSGLGLELAIGFAKKGYSVFGTVLSPMENDEIKARLKDLDITFTVADITKEADVKNWGAFVDSKLNNNGLNILVNNAGVLTPGPMEVLQLNAIRKEFEVNVFGSIAVINEFLPLLRKAKGRIVQIGSMTGRFPLPFSGPSSASKATMEAFADVYRFELMPFGVEFVMAQPGNMLTGGPAKTAAQLKQISDHMTAEQKELYDKYFSQFSTVLNTMQAAGLSAEASAKRIIEISEQVPAPIRAAVGDDAAEILQMVHEKSDEELDQYRMKFFGFDKLIKNK
jgi:NAD(P)-dependent dehydrogenase (short-subunit alcohol dehydrogenase family)